MGKDKLNVRIITCTCLEFNYISIYVLLTYQQRQAATDRPDLGDQ